ncbi:TonB family protein [candidate division WOR-3 bacterium]|nr:TonB family protein [candidate division WOR-3 bacterium]
MPAADIVHKQLPPYPSWAKEKELGFVKVGVCFLVDTSGMVMPTLVVTKSSGNTDWDFAVAEALRGWEFSPGDAGRKGEITFYFVLHEPEEIKTEVPTSGLTQSFELSGDLSVADILSKQLPDYPSWAKEKGYSKVRVTISFSVDASGTVLPTMVVRTSSGYTQWDNQVKQALLGWKFTEAEEVRKAQITFWFVLS